MKNPGFLVELAQKILGTFCHKVVYSFRPWSRAVKDTLVMDYQLEKKNLRSQLNLADQGKTNLIYIAFATNHPK